jgi:hypothetical protein
VGEEVRAIVRGRRGGGPRLIVTYSTSGGPEPPPLPVMTIGDVTVSEGAASGVASFVVSLSPASTQTVTASYTTVAGTALAASDFVAASGTVTFAPGVTSQAINITLINDSITEPTESFSATLAGAANATIGDNTGVATVTDDDTGPPPSGPVTATFQIAAGTDDVNEDGTTFDASGGTVWVGNASVNTASYTGLRFTGVSIPRNATITSARLEVNAAATQWIGLGFEIGIEAASTSAPFGTAARPSQRTLLTPRVQHSSDGQWIAGTWYQLDQIAPIVQALVTRSDWNAGNALALVLRGTGNAWARKSAQAYEGTAALAPRLVVTYVVP